MRRQDKYPDTEVFHYFNANPKNRITTDCVVRAICLATQKSYATVVMDLAKLQCETGYDDGDKPLIDRYLQMQGFLKQKQPKKPNGKSILVESFAKKQPLSQDAMLQILAGIMQQQLQTEKSMIFGTALMATLVTIGSSIKQKQAQEAPE